MQQMVKMSPLQSYSVEIVPDDHNTRVIGSAVAQSRLPGCKTVGRHLLSLGVLCGDLLRV